MFGSSRIGSFGWKDHRRRRAGYKGTSGGLAVCISACEDKDGKAANKSVSSNALGILFFFPSILMVDINQLESIYRIVTENKVFSG
jgi:hypothetical protein